LLRLLDCGTAPAPTVSPFPSAPNERDRLEAAERARCFGQAPEILTPRLRLRPFGPDDHMALQAIMARPETFEFSDRQPMTPGESWARLLRHVGHWSLFGFGMFAVEERTTGALIGEIGFADFRRGFGTGYDGVPEAAWTIVPERWGLGYAQEAALGAHQWVDGQKFGASTVCMIFCGNLRSLRVAVKLGYVPFRQLSHNGNPAILFRRLRGAI
jgi:RimJ/RimL family protein N-acetyltransferase